MFFLLSRAFAFYRNNNNNKIWRQHIMINRTMAAQAAAQQQRA